ncbi:MAG: dihydroorotase [Deltaproteobacteria bacterium]|uniref:Dihydroorotase n=1 Tax=Candidatus Zymogenus saltonus TaxID=2844893 RepID=A0A9D8PNC8_9DELT|nr:dihydroorotase [Candidatus Zymogenus saltonus]
MTRILISGGTIVNPGGDYEGPGGLLVEGGVVIDFLKPGEIVEGAVVYDAAGMVVSPGIIDVHTHLREPGYEYKETIATGTRSAAAGGVTTVFCMANTNPVNDSGEVTKYILERAREGGVVTVCPVGAVTKGLSGELLTDPEELKGAGVFALSDDGNVVSNSGLMRRGMIGAKRFNLPVITHSEDMTLVDRGVMNEGKVSEALGLAGNNAAAEEIMIMRDVTLAKITGARLHVAHVTCAGGVKIIRGAKARGINVTAETCPHYFSLTEEAVRELGTNAKVNPPLRTEEDRLKVIEGIVDGTIDVIASDHAPHAGKDKEVEFPFAMSGMVGLETLLPLSLRLVHEKRLTLSEMIKKLTVNPACALGISGGVLKKGGDADVTVIDPDEEWVVDPEKLFSKSKNTPFSGWKMRGRVRLTMVKGKTVFKDGKIMEGKNV